MNARFWFTVNGNAVKLTLRPGESLHYWRGGATDEGWQRVSYSFEFDGDTVTVLCESDGSDCDGRLSSTNELFCPVGLLRMHRAIMHYWIDGQPVSIPDDYYSPDWQHGRSSQRDYFAEAMNY